VPDALAKVFMAALQLYQSEMVIPTKKLRQSTVKPTNDVGMKPIQLLEGDQSKTSLIGAGLSDK
jgi:hypothetical protein